ncbi:hypothetical protein PXNS11_110191 [Stutzerimonas xanthomarina]|nr:hypothetical protein PXNS11_110191 [Stutzerimonas xanthomarina]
MLSEKARVACVIARQYPGGAADDHRAALGACRPPQLRGEGETIGAVQGNGLGHGKDLSNCCAATLPRSAHFCHILPAPLRSDRSLFMTAALPLQPGGLQRNTSS